jgi:hypothetical protein
MTCGHTHVCCPKFDPESGDEKEFVWVRYERCSPYIDQSGRSFPSSRNTLVLRRFNWL